MGDEAEVAAVRVAPGSYRLQAGRICVGLVFVVDGDRYEVTGQPAPIGSDRYMAVVRRPDGGRLTAQLEAAGRST
ncbi:hypothetical protein ACFCV3_41625 [Kribbella sp. NPDC056345]|uniref:hypothetical protein n=1 Tax=Kribbella sp. NPDC056345 TaxID=3345789 RepID=UPI0035E07BE7